MFETLLSNKNMKDALEYSLKTGTTLHAYLFCGPDGSGKLTAANAFAAEIIGDKDRVLRGSHPDVIYIRAEEGKSTIPVEVVRDMRADAFVTPTEAAKKVYIIDGAHQLNDHGQNALLTILEQPPSFCVFILLSENREKILPTVISRCCVYEMEYVNDEDGAKALQKEFGSEPPSSLKTYMRAAQGNIGLAKKMIADATLLSNVESCEQLCIAIANGDRYAVSKIIISLAKNKAVDFLNVLTVYLRDIIVLNTTGNESGIVFYDSILKNKSVFAKIKTDRLYRCVIECQKSVSQLESSINLTLVLTSLTINLYGGKTVD